MYSVSDFALGPSVQLVQILTSEPWQFTPVLAVTCLLLPLLIGYMTYLPLLTSAPEYSHSSTVRHACG